MATYYISGAGNDTSGDGSQGSPWRTLSKLNTTLTAGDIGIISPGSYTGTSNRLAPVNSGTEGNHITYRAASPGVSISDPNASNVSNIIDVRSKSYITIEGLNFLSTSAQWLQSNSTSHYIWLQECGFNSSLGAQAFAFVGILFHGDYCRVHDCSVGNWMGGDTIASYGDHTWIKGNDFNFNDSGHGPVVMYGSYFVVEQNYVRNKWGRGGHFAPERFDIGAPLRGVVQRNTFFDCNPVNYTPNEGYPLQGWAASDDDGPGDAQILKTGGRGLIFRRNLVVAMNTGEFTFSGGSKPRPYKAIIQIDNYDNTVVYDKGRYYHNTFLDNPFNGVSVTENTVTPHALEYDDNRFVNNIFANCTGGQSFRMATNTGDYLSTFKWYNNLLTEQLRRGSTFYDADDFDAAFSSQAAGNISTAPTFVDDDYSAALANRALRIDANNFALAPGSAGKGAGRHLATVASNSSGTTITLGDGEAWFFTDGNDLITGDEISINGNVRTVTGVPAENQLTVNSAVSVTAGQEVYLTEFGTDPDMGIVATEGTDPVENPIGVTLLGTRTGSGTLTSISTNSVTPSAGQLLCIIASYNSSVVQSAPLSASVTTTLSGVGTWEKVEEQVSEESVDSGVCAWIAEGGSNPGTGTITVNFSAAITRYCLVCFEIDNYDASGNTIDAIVQTAKITNTSATLTATLGATPGADNLVIAAVNSRGESVGITKDADYTLLGEANANPNWLHVQYRIGGEDTTAGWSDLTTTRNTALIFEVALGQGIVVDPPDPPLVYQFIAPPTLMPSLGVNISMGL